eukprot:8640542-Pyramimonas_sp.AAC.1
MSEERQGEHMYNERDRGGRRAGGGAAGGPGGRGGEGTETQEVPQRRRNRRMEPCFSSKPWRWGGGGRGSPPCLPLPRKGSRFSSSFSSPSATSVPPPHHRKAKTGTAAGGKDCWGKGGRFPPGP